MGQRLYMIKNSTPSLRDFRVAAGYLLLRILSPQRRRGRRAYAERCLAAVIICARLATLARAHTPAASPAPPGNRGLGIQSAGPTSTTATDQRSSEAKPE